MAANPVPPNTRMRLSIEKKADETIVRLSGRIIAETSAELQTTIRSLIPETKRIVLDMTGVDYIDSSGIGALVSVYLSASKAQCSLELANPQPRIRDLFEVSRLTAVFESRGGYRGMES
jgi:anti-sigma B factor antagonist